jgi:TonB family protein
MPAGKSFAVSLALHFICASLLLLLTTQTVRVRLPTVQRPVTPLAPPRRFYALALERSGGSNQTLLPARHGQPPPRAHRTFIPPVTLQEPKLRMPVTVAFESPTIEISFAQIGDPASDRIIGSLGTIGDNGAGNRCCGPGVGDQDSGKPGIGARARIGGKTTTPELIYRVEPEFSEAARKAKYQGVVILAIEVGADGRPKNLRVIEPLGLGLDEKAIEAVARWRFRPGLRDGKPVVTAATVEVRFRLM